MGLIKHLLLWPVSGPAAMVSFTLGQLQGMTERELADDTRVKEKLLDLQLRLEVGEIGEEEYLERESEVLEELRSVREWQERLGLASARGPVRFSHDADAGDAIVEESGEWSSGSATDSEHDSPSS